jgi:hypothetical protein
MLSHVELQKCCMRLIVLLYKKLLAYFNILSINIYSDRDASRLQVTEMNSEYSLLEHDVI